MWNLFKEREEPKEEIKQEVKKDVIVLEKTKQSYPAVVLEIHKEFETSADKLLKQAQDAVNDTTPVISEEKSSLLKKHGFSNTEEIIKQKEVDRQVSLSKGQIELITYYKQNYPFNKFIFPNQVEQICKKYNLVFGKVSDYKGFVPEKNLKEIDDFKLKDEDIAYEKTFYGFTGHHTSPATYEEYKNATSKEKSASWNSDVSYSKNQTLEICAPIHDMDIHNKRLVDGYKLEDVPLDPVVLMPVRGNGYLILTAWGDESKDPLVVNEILN